MRRSSRKRQTPARLEESEPPPKAKNNERHQPAVTSASSTASTTTLAQHQEVSGSSEGLQMFVPPPGMAMESPQPALPPPQASDTGTVPDLQWVPPMVSSVHEGLSIGIPQSVRDKISCNQYVELATLLHSNQAIEPQGQRITISKDGQLTLAPPAIKKIVTIEEWTDAFLIFASIYLKVHPAESTNILKYMSVIRGAAKRHLGLGWQSYDIQFRLRVAANPSAVSFGSIDQELWLLCMGPSTMASFSGDKKCYDFNFRSCSRIVCSFRHSCMNCSGNHPLRTCRQPSLQANFPRPGSSGSTTFVHPRTPMHRAPARPFRPRMQFRPRF